MPPQPPPKSVGASPERSPSPPGRRGHWRSFELASWSLFGMLMVQYFVAMAWAHLWQLQRAKTDAAPPPATHPTQPPPPSHAATTAVVTLITSEGYLDALGVLAHSLRLVNTTADLVAAYVPENVSQRTLCVLRSQGWSPRPIERLEPIIDGFRGPALRNWFWTYTKLRLWSWTDYESLVFLDGDTLALDSIEPLFGLTSAGVSFAAVIDSYPDDHPTHVINSGVMLIRPNLAEYDSLLRAMTTSKRDFDIDGGDQAFLSHVYRSSMFNLPYRYNVNLAYAFQPKVWGAVWPTAAIVHYTLEKPFKHIDDRIPREAKEYVEPFKSWHRVRDDLLRDEKRTREAKNCKTEDVSVSDDYDYPTLDSAEDKDRRKWLTIFAVAVDVSLLLLCVRSFVLFYLSVLLETRRSGRSFVPLHEYRRHTSVHTDDELSDY